MSSNEAMPRFINDTFMPRTGRKAPSITPLDLAKIISDAALNLSKSYFADSLWNEDADVSDDINMAQMVYELLENSNTFRRDNKFSVEFDNIDSEFLEEYSIDDIRNGMAPPSGTASIDMASTPHPLQVGFLQTNTGLSFLGLVGGGDEQHPVYVCIYWDGKKLRMYIPTRGNAVNAALGCAFFSEADAFWENPKKAEQKIKRYLLPGHNIANVIDHYILDNNVVVNDYLHQFGIYPQNGEPVVNNIPFDMNGILEDICTRISVV